MADPVDFAATIASLQEQIDTLNGELAGHRKLISTGDIDAFWLLFRTSRMSRGKNHGRAPRQKSTQSVSDADPFDL